MDVLFARYVPRVRRIVSLRIGKREDAIDGLDDAIQEGFLRAFGKLDSFEWKNDNDASLRDWLARLVQNSLVDEVRRGKAVKRGGGRELRFGDFRDSSLTVSIFGADSPTPSAIARGAEVDALIEGALLELNPRHREIIVLRQLCGLDYDEIAARIGFLEGAARTSFSRAMDALRELLPPGFVPPKGREA
jgi:RNA polymerase sigma-70 factor (ECF subfamily)